MSSPNRSVLRVNILYWFVAALIYPLAGLLPTGSGDTPKIYSILIPIFFMLLAYGSTTMVARALTQAAARADEGGN